jgi:hypothetical protein
VRTISSWQMAHHAGIRFMMVQGAMRCMSYGFWTTRLMASISKFRVCAGCDSAYKRGLELRLQ